MHFEECVLVTREKTRTQPVFFEECVLVTKESSGSHPANTHITRTFFLASCNPGLFEIEYYIENTGIMIRRTDMARNRYFISGILRLMVLVLVLAVMVSFSFGTEMAFADTESDATEEASADETEAEGEDGEDGEEGTEEAAPRLIPEDPSMAPDHKTVLSPTYVYNSLTGQWGLDPSKIIPTRTVGVVVENHPAARPQWGMDDKYFAPDIILEGEVEGGISRMLWIWADYNKMPYMVGPVRSARPPFVRFSEFFDAMFVHWGMSETGGGYTGADYYFWNDGVNHLDGMYYESSGPFGRNWSSGRSSEHLAVVYGGILPSYLESYFNTARRPERTTELSFYRDKEPRGPKASCQELDVKFSRISGSTHWSYDSKTQKYYTPSFKTNASRDNLLILMDTTYYVTKVSTTYCNYNFAGGDAYLASCGAVENIKWRVENGKLRLYRNVPVKNADGTETTVEETVSLNPGKTYIGWASSNYGGYCTITPGEAAPEPSKAFVYDEPTMFRGYW